MHAYHVFIQAGTISQGRNTPADADFAEHRRCDVPADGETQELLYKRADLALYEAKRTGRNTRRWYHSELGA